MRLRWLAVLGGLVTVAPAAAQQSAEALPFDPAVRRGVLPNGLTYYLRPNGFPARRAELRLVVDAGSVLEDDDQRGLAHVLEHLAFDGTPRFPGRSVWRFFERVGLRVGADVNATTGFDETIYRITVPTDSAGLLSEAVMLLAEWASRLALDPAELPRERQVVLEEWRTALGPGQRLFGRQLDALLPGSRYPGRLPIGGPEGPVPASVAAVRRFYADWYRPERMAVVIVGDIDPAALEQVIAGAFGGGPSGADARVPPPRVLPALSASQAVVVADSEVGGTVVTLHYREEGGPTRTEADVRLAMARALFDVMLNERLGERVLAPAPPFLQAGAAAAGLVRGVQTYQLSAAVEAGGTVAGVAALRAEVARVVTAGFTPSELARARLQLERGLGQAEAERDKVSSAALADQLAADHLVGDPTLALDLQLALSRRLLPQLEEPEIRAAGLARLAVPPVAVVSAPATGPVPAEADVLAALAASVESLAPVRDDAGDHVLLPARPSPGHVRRSDRVPVVGVQRLELSNGVRVLLKPTDYHRGEVLLHGYRAGGFGVAPPARSVPAATAQELVCGGGVAGLDPVALARALAGRVVRLGCSITRYGEGLSGASAPADLETLLQLVYLQSSAPRLDPAIVARYKAGLREALAHRGADPHEALADTLSLLLADHSPELRLLDSAFVAELDPDASLAFFRERFGDPTGFTFVLVGAFHPDSVLPLLEHYLGGLPVQPRADTLAPRGIAPPAAPVNRVLHRGREPRSTTALVFHREGPVTRPQAVALAALVHVFRHRLQDRLRQDLAGVYTVDVSGGLTAVPGPSYRISVEFDADPARHGELQRALAGVVDRLADHGPTREELESFRLERSRELETARVSNQYWLSAITTADQRGWPLEELLLDAEAEALTRNQVREVARTFLSAAGRVSVTLLPE